MTLWAKSCEAVTINLSIYLLILVLGTSSKYGHLGNILYWCFINVSSGLSAAADPQTTTLIQRFSLYVLCDAELNEMSFDAIKCQSLFPCLSICFHTHMYTDDT